MIKLKIGDTVFLEDINVHAIVQSVGQILHTGGTVETFFKENGVIETFFKENGVIETFFKENGVIETFFKENGVIEKVLGQREMPRVVIELQQVEVER